MGRIRTRIVLGFVAVTLLPAVPLAILVRDLIERSFAPPFAEEAAEVLEIALEDSRARLHEQTELFSDDLRMWIAPFILREPDLGEAGANGTSDVLREGDLVFPADDPGDAPQVLARWAARHAGNAPGQEGRVEGERVGNWIAAAVIGPEGRPWVVARPLPRGLAERATRVVATIGLLRAFQGDRVTVVRSYVLPFLISYAFLLFVAVMMGALLARRIARPVEALSKGAARVGAGNLDTRVVAAAPDEVGRLVTAFNRMVTDLARQRDELVRLERVAAWRDLARSLAHEIKNPLTPIQLAVQQLADRYPAQGDDAAYRELLRECTGIVNEEIEALRRLVREFSEFARLPEPAPEPGDAGALLDEIVRLYGADRVARRGEGALPARFDAAEMKRALVNLVDNALAACRAVGRPERAELSGEATADGVRLRVTDRGAGIAPADRERIFEPNFSTKKEGMGLGLAIVEGIVRGHGGSIGMDSAPGEGTTFTIELPSGAAGGAWEAGR